MKAVSQDTSDNENSQKSRLILALNQWLTLIAFIAAALFIWRSDKFPEIELVSLPLLISATLVQLVAFTTRALFFRVFLRQFDIRTTFRQAMVCIFRPILTKYIPGKVWLLLSTVGLLYKEGVSLKKGSAAVGVFQVCLAVSGLILGAVALLVYQLPGVSDKIRFLLSTLSIVGLVLLLLLPKFLAWLGHWFPRLGMGAAELPSFSSLALSLFYGMLHWLVIGLAFSLFLLAFGVHAGWYALLFQPLAINIGVLAIIVPGGLGVREGAMAAYLAIAEVPIAYALTLAFAARVWFFVGEVISFGIGFLLDRR